MVSCARADRVVRHYFRCKSTKEASWLASFALPLASVTTASHDTSSAVHVADAGISLFSSWLLPSWALPLDVHTLWDFVAAQA